MHCAGWQGAFWCSGAASFCGWRPPRKAWCGHSSSSRTAAAGRCSCSISSRKQLRMPPTPWQKSEAVRPRMPRCRLRCTKPNGNCPKLQITGCVNIFSLTKQRHKPMSWSWRSFYKRNPSAACRHGCSLSLASGNWRKKLRRAVCRAAGRNRKRPMRPRKRFRERFYRPLRIPLRGHRICTSAQRGP